MFQSVSNNVDRTHQISDFKSFPSTNEKENV
jgi:hypothetical protein